MMAVQGWGAWQTGVVAADALRKGGTVAAWAAASPRLLSIFLRVNLAGLLFTALQLGGQWWYNRKHRTALDQWLEQSPWGAKNAGLSLDAYQRQFLEIVAEPEVELRLQQGQAYLAIRFPELSADLLESSQLTLTAFRRGPTGSWADWSEELNAQLELAKEEPLELRLPLLDKEVDEQYSLSFSLQYQSALLSGAERELRYYLDDLNPVTPRLWHTLGWLQPPRDAVKPVSPVTAPRMQGEGIAPLRLEDLR